MKVLALCWFRPKLELFRRYVGIERKSPDGGFTVTPLHETGTGLPLAPPGKNCTTGASLHEQPQTLAGPDIAAQIITQHPTHGYQFPRCRPVRRPPGAPGYYAPPIPIRHSLPCPPHLPPCNHFLPPPFPAETPAPLLPAFGSHVRAFAGRTRGFPAFSATSVTACWGYYGVFILTSFVFRDANGVLRGLVRLLAKYALLGIAARFDRGRETEPTYTESSLSTIVNRRSPIVTQAPSRHAREEGRKREGKTCIFKSISFFLIFTPSRYKKKEARKETRKPA